MDWLRDNSILEILHSFSEHNMEPASLVHLVESLGWGDVVTEPIVRTASSYATICCETDYELSFDDYSWLENATCLCEAQIDRQRHIVAIDLDCNSDNYYLFCAALVKILNHVKTGDCLFVFKLNDGIVFGSKRSFGDFNASDFCISCFVPDDLDCCEEDEVLGEFLSSLEMAEWNEIPQLIIDFSPQEKIAKTANYDRERYNPEYVAFLRDFSAMYGVDTSRQVDEYTHSFDEYQEPTDITYRDAIVLLERIGIDRGSSYDILNAADEAVALSKQLQLGEDIGTGLELLEAADRIIHQYSEEAFENAELLLREMMKRDI